MANQQNPTPPPNGDDAPRGRYLTTGEKIRNFTGWAFAIALLLELVAVPFYHHYGHAAQEQTEKPITITKETIKPPPTPPPPTPTPPPTPQPHQTVQPHVQPQQPRLKLNVQHVHSQGAGPSVPRYVAPPRGSENGVPQGTATNAPPAPVATPATCANPDQEAHTLQVAEPDYPESAQELGLGEVTVEVVVNLGPNGNVLGVSIGNDPAHNSAIEQEALRVARMTTYAPKMVACKPVTSEYQYLVTFQPD